MKKKNLNPLSLDKETIAKLNEDQIDAIVGGKKKGPDGDDDDECRNQTCRGVSHYHLEDGN